MIANYLYKLKSSVLVKAAIRYIHPTDCSGLAIAIEQDTGTHISEDTLLHLFGFKTNLAESSILSLNTLSVFCGFPTWVAFCKQVDNEAFNNQASDAVITDPLILAAMDTDTPLVVIAAEDENLGILEYNLAFEEATHVQQRNIRGLSWWDAFKPENAGGYGPTQLLEAFHEAIYKQQTIYLNPIHYNIPTSLPVVTEISWWDIKIVPVKYDGKVKYLLLHVNNITNKILHQDAIEEAILKELTNAEDLAATNVKLTSVIERLEQSHQELFKTKEQLEEWVFERTRKLFESENRQRQVIENAPVAIAVLKGPQHRIEVANKRVTDYWGKGADVIGKPLAEVLPEIESQGFISLLDNVRKTGVAYSNTELRALINFKGIIQPRYFDMVYQPIQHTQGVTDSIYIIAFDITEQVEVRKALEASESLLRLAANAANIGIWSFNLDTKLVSFDKTYCQIIGWPEHMELKYEQGLSHVVEGSREALNAQIEDAMANNTELNFTYHAKRFDNGRPLKLNVIGRVAVNSAGEKLMSGIIKELV